MPRTTPSTGPPPARPRREPHGLQGPEPERILIVRLTAVGDVIHGAPVLCALRDRFPDAYIAWVVEGVGGDLLQGHRALNQLIRVPRRWYKSPRQVWSLRRRLRAEGFDTAVDLQCLTKSALVAWMSGAPRRLGCAAPDGRELSPWLNNVQTPVDADHVVHHYLGILAPLGIAVRRSVGAPRPEGFESIRFDLEERGPAARYAAEAIDALGLRAGRFAVLNPGAGWASKLWPTERYAQVASRLQAEHGVRSLAVWAGEGERALAQQIVARSGGAATLAPGTTLPQLAAVCRRAALFLGSDTGPMHLAAAVGTPTVSLHGTTEAGWCGAYGSGNLALQAEFADGSYGERRRAANDAMLALSVDRVSQACGEAMARTQAVRRAG
ncbi:MAG: glycosyltransferase family 9 protein [Planctomycetota bacterium]